MKKISYTVLSLFLFTGTALAQQGYEVLAPLPNIQGQTTINSYVPAAINIAITVGAVLAFVMITFGGILYATTDAISGKQKGKDYITNAIYGLLLVIGAWVILNFINPDTLNFNFSLDKPNIGTAPEGTGIGTSGGTGGSSTPAGTAATCNTCSTLYSLNLPFKSDLPTNVSVDSQFGAKLVSLDNNYGLSWIITEGYPPTYQHGDPCHSNGTCVDARPLQTAPKAIQDFYNATNKTGFGYVQYEVKTVADKAVLENALSGGKPLSWIVVNTKASNPHFHIEQ